MPEAWPDINAIIAASMSTATATIVAGNVSVDVPHTLGVVPSIVTVELQDDLAGRNWFVTGKTALKFTLNINGPDIGDHVFVTRAYK